MGKTIIVVEHDTDFLWLYTKEVLILEKGKIIAVGSTKEILSRSWLLQNLGLKPPRIKNL